MSVGMMGSPSSNYFQNYDDYDDDKYIFEDEDDRENEDPQDESDEGNFFYV